MHSPGLHIPPGGTADNIFLEIPPGEGFDDEFQLAPNQAAGTFWWQRPGARHDGDPRN